MRENAAKLFDREHVRSYCEKICGGVRAHRHDAGSYQIMQRKRAFIGQLSPSTTCEPPEAYDVFEYGWTPFGERIDGAVEILCDCLGVHEVIE